MIYDAFFWRKFTTCSPLAEKSLPTILKSSVLQTYSCVYVYDIAYILYIHHLPSTISNNIHNISNAEFVSKYVRNIMYSIMHI